MNFMPFWQLKSFLKILIEVQYQQLKVQLPLQRLYLLGNGRLRNEIFLRRLGKAVQPNNRLNVFELSLHLRASHYDHLSFLIITQESSIRPPTATAALTSISTTMNETTVRQNCFLKNISKVSAYKRPQRGSMTSCSPFLWNPGNPRCFFDAGHILIKKMAGKHPGTEQWKSAFAASAFSAGRTQKP